MESYFATIGFFDGVHRGHRDLINQLIEVAKKRKMKSAVVTFRQHPRKVLNQDYQPQLLTSCGEKEWLLETTCDMDEYFMLDFTVELAALSAKDFMQFLRDKYNVKGLLIGYDHKFGHNRSEGFDDYVRYGKELGIEVLQAKPFMTQSGLTVSSSIIRQFVKEGNMTEAALNLGCGYLISGTVVHGHQIGRTIGFPTANIKLDEDDKLLPPDGVYGVRVLVDDGLHPGMMNIGKRPTMDNGDDRSIEVNLFYYKENLYDKLIRVWVIDRVREEKKFDSMEELVAQLEEDKGKIVQMFNESDN